MSDWNQLTPLHYWSIGVGSVIGGDFFGWQPVLTGGIGHAFVAFSVVALLYGILAYCITLLSSRCDHGGAYIFVSQGIGPRLGVLVACMETMKLFLVLCALGFGLVGYIHAIVDISNYWQYVVYFVLITVFCALSSKGTAFSGDVQFYITSACLLVLCFYWLSMSTKVDFVANATPEKTYFYSYVHCIQAFPFAAWFFLGFEELPLLPSADLSSSSLSRGMVYSYLTVATSGLLTMILSAAGRPGIDGSIDTEPAPLSSGIHHIYSYPVSVLFDILSILALLCPFYSFILYCAHHLQTSAKVGIVPTWVVYDGASDAPHRALVLVALVAFALMSLLGGTLGLERSSVAVVTASLLPATISYMMQLAALRHMLWNDQAQMVDAKVPLVEIPNNRDIIVKKPEYYRRVHCLAVIAQFILLYMLFSLMYISVTTIEGQCGLIVLAFLFVALFLCGRKLLV